MTNTTFTAILDLFDSDAPGCRMEALRLARESGHHLRLRAIIAARREADRVEAEARREARAAEAEQRLTDAYLEDVAGSTDPQARQARILLMLPTIDQRQAAQRGAHRYMNATPGAGRYSDALLSVVTDMLAGVPA